MAERRLIMKKSNGVKICPSCGKKYKGFPSLSRRDNKTEICSDCGLAEAMIAFTQSAEKKRK